MCLPTCPGCNPASCPVTTGNVRPHLKDPACSLNRIVVVINSPLQGSLLLICLILQICIRTDRMWWCFVSKGMNHMWGFDRRINKHVNHVFIKPVFVLQNFRFKLTDLFQMCSGAGLCTFLLWVLCVLTEQDGDWWVSNLTKLPQKSAQGPLMLVGLGWGENDKHIQSIICLSARTTPTTTAPHHQPSLYNYVLDVWSLF